MILSARTLVQVWFILLEDMNVRFLGLLRFGTKLYINTGNMQFDKTRLFLGVYFGTLSVQQFARKSATDAIPLHHCC